MSTNASSASKKPSSWGRRLLLIVAVIVVLLIGAYLFGTSAAFLKGFVLPRVSKAIGSEITVADASVHPFSQVTLNKLKVQTEGQDPLLEAEEISIRYSLFDLLGGNYRVQEVTIVSPTIQIVQRADGGGNLQSFMQKMRGPAVVTPGKAAPPVAGPPAKALRLSLNQVSLKHATVRWSSAAKDGSQTTAELSGVEVSVDRFENGQSGKVTFSAAAGVKQSSPSGPAASGSLQAKTSGAFDLSLDNDLAPQVVKGAARFDVTDAQGTFAEVGGLGAALDCDLTMKEVRQVALRFERGGQSLGKLQISGPIDLAKSEGKLKVEILALDRQALNLVGAPGGFGFGNTVLNSTNQIELTQAGAAIAASGSINARELSVRQAQSVTPAIDLEVNYQVAVDLKNKSLIVRQFNVSGRQTQRDLLRVSLSQPMSLSWGQNQAAGVESALELTISQLDLKDWRAFLGAVAPGGRIDARLMLTAKNDGRRLDTELTTQISGLTAQAGANQLSADAIQLKMLGGMDDFKNVRLDSLTMTATNCSAHFTTNQVAAASLQVKVVGKLNDLKNASLESLSLTASSLSGQFGTNRLAPVELQMNTQGTLTDLKLAHLERLGLQLSQSNRDMVVINGSGDLNLATGDAGMQLTAQVDVPAFARQLAGLPLASSAGTLKLTAAYAKKGAQGQATGNLALDDFTGRYGDYHLQNFQTHVEFALDITGQQIALRKAVATLRSGGAAGGSFDLTGGYALDKKSGELKFVIAELNQNVLSPFAAPVLAPKRLVSATVNASGSASFDPAGDAAIKADAKLSNLVLDNGKSTNAALAVETKMDGSWHKQTLALRQFSLALTPTARATNQIEIQGTLDLSKTNAMQGNITLRAPSLDFTPYYDLLESQKVKEQARAAVATNAPAVANVEPKAMALPIQQFTADLKIDRLYLRELAITNWVSTAKINRSEIALAPCQLSVNGAAIDASVTLNLGVDGYTYKVALKTGRIPVAPVANTFSAAYRGHAEGELLAQLDINGAGVTGVNLRRSLAGHVGFSLTNANIQVVGPKARAILSPIALVLGVPELLSSPLDYVNADIQAGGGNIQIKQFTAHSAAFLAESQGTIPINDVLTNSPLNQPIDVSLPASLGSRFTLGSNPGTNGYVKLPNFVRLIGTLGAPQAKTDRAVIAEILAKGVAGAVGGRVGGILQGVGSLLGGERTASGATNAAPASNTNQPPRFNPFDLFRPPPKQ